jgi:Gram-negative bacterial TonB protein C-terminal
VTCPSYVFPIGEPMAESAGGAPVIAATRLQSLGRLTCGRMYRDPSGPEDFSGLLIGQYGNRPLSVKLHVYIDSNGNAIDEKVIGSSGFHAVDVTAVGIVQQQKFNPAEFLCTPVVGEMLLQLDYRP